MARTSPQPGVFWVATLVLSGVRHGCKGVSSRPVAGSVQKRRLRRLHPVACIIPYKRVHDAPITKDGPKRLHRHQKDGPRALHNDTWQMALLPNQSPCPPRYALARQRNKEAKLREHQRAEVELGLEAAAGDQAHDLGG